MVLDDTDSDGKMDTNFLGAPSEAVGASRGAAGRYANALVMIAPQREII